MSLVTRFAPSPTGLLHLGHAHSALVAYRAAMAANGRFLLRIEDIDRTRCRTEFIAAIESDLNWLGLGWEQPMRRQSDHLADYRKDLDRLREMGMVYPCFCTRTAIVAEIHDAALAPHGPDGPHYPGTCRRLDAAERNARLERGEGHAWRLDSKAAARRAGSLSFIEHGRAIEVLPELFGDAVIARKDIGTSYHLSVVHDDHVQGVTLVTRGEDLLPATHIHRVLQALLDYPPPAYAHHMLLRDPSGRRLAKRDRDTTLRELRQTGVSAAEARERAGFPD